MKTLPNLAPLAPELLLAGFAILLLMFGVFRSKRSARGLSWLAVIALVATGIVMLGTSVDGTIVVWRHFIVDGFGRFMKVLVLLGSVFAIMISMAYNEREKMARFEYPVLILFATLGMMMMISAGDLIALYVGVELQSLSLYVLAAFNRDSARSSEAGLKYFVLGALSSGMLLYGCSMIYGFTGTTGFAELAVAMRDGGTPGIGLVTGLVFLLAGLAFKVSAVPFHMWTPDVYEGAPTPVTAFFSAAPKIAAISLFVRVLMEPFGDLIGEWRQIIVVISVASMILGALAAIWQTNIKRLLAYSSIGHVGYALVGLAAGSELGISGVIIYMSIYLTMTIGAFTCVLCMRRGERMVEGIDELAGLAQTSPRLALALGIFMFSMAGIPPLAGFWGKFFVFEAAVKAGLYELAIIGVLTSVVGAFYYLRIVKLMYFDAAAEPFERPIGGAIATVLVVTALFNLLFLIYPSPLLTSAEAAARLLFTG